MPRRLGDFIMSFIKQTKQVGSVSIRESGRAIALSARVVSELAYTALAGVVVLNAAVTKDLNEENKAKLQSIVDEIDSSLQSE